MIAKAEDKLETAQLNYNNYRFDDAVSRAYYAVFHAVSAALFSKGLHFSKHGQVIGNFNKEFIKTKILPEEITPMIQKLFDERQIGDYFYYENSIDKDTAKDDINNAQFIISSIKKYLGIN
ncbi:MAG: HEPN domain-containing protein [Spirochaetota bacterium]|nr:HEPN domain-containing protein [Spirochaetota bacterium]